MLTELLIYCIYFLCYYIKVLRISKEDPSELSQHEDLVLAVADHLASDNLDVGLTAASCLTQLGGCCMIGD